MIAAIIRLCIFARPRLPFFAAAASEEAQESQNSTSFRFARGDCFKD